MPVRAAATGRPGARAVPLKGPRSRLDGLSGAQLIVGVFRAAIRGVEHASKASRGRLQNLMATDADRIGDAAALIWTVSQWTFSVCCFPAIVYFMWELLGNAAFVGMGTHAAPEPAPRAVFHLACPAWERRHAHR